MSTEKIINLASYAGKILLQSGAEIYRVEETMNKICMSFNVQDAESFVTPTGIIISITGKDGKITSTIKRIQTRTVDLEKISEVNDLSRLLQRKSLPLQEVEAKLKKIDNEKKHSDFFLITFSAIAAGFFTLIFGGTFRDFSAAFLIGLLIKIFSIALSRLNINDFFLNLVGGAIAALIALILKKLGFIIYLDKTIIGSIMLLVPGLAITNAVRDTIAGDLVSGISRALEAFFIAVAIAAGTGLVFKIWINFFGGTGL
ncbi:threonine/serine exporter family protein [Clostridium felsineum]|uniref:threonine/serine exporter family protein n=1 Tax=Clostridium felsineum TaxID=36839 RepID=UPI00098CA254|nr:threonine/serine exporter family protein [Clostridium felsineum]MCR3759071.1 threonine/serine exporter family protein [Clostridium felsineum]URZ16752.1 Inner membrane protein YjjP [Clostridium felsineum DSM 794]